MAIDISAMGTLVTKPSRSTNEKGVSSVSARLKVATSLKSVLVSVMAFGQQAEVLLKIPVGSVIIARGQGYPTCWTKDGATQAGISIVAKEVQEP